MTYNYSATQNNGRIASSQDAITGENTTYSYDALNRLTAASNSLWNQSYTYDGFGNLLTKSQAGGSPNPSPAVSLGYNANNQVTNSGYTYDGNGNLQCSGSYSNCATYNVENRVVYSGAYGSQTVYAYDPWGKRVMVNTGGDSGTYTWTFYGITGQPLAILQCDASSFPSNPTCAIVGQNVYFGKRMIVSGGVNVVTDRLGTIRANSQGESFAYYPYGDERTNTVDSRPKFGTYFRDAVGQDYADQRYYNAGMGRFWSVDPGGIRTAVPSRPSSWNRYAYTEGDPVNAVDPQGTNLVFVGTSWCWVGGAETGGWYDCDLYSSEGAGGGGIGDGDDTGGGASDDVSKQYSESVDCNKTPGQIISDMESNFAGFANYSGPSGRRVCLLRLRPSSSRGPSRSDRRSASRMSTLSSTHCRLLV